MTKVLIAGDTHGSIQQFVYLHRIMMERDIKRGIVVGDFGLWPGPHGKRFLNGLSALCKKDGIEWEWLDGNHEDHDRIEMWMKREDAYNKRHRVVDHVYYLPRGYRFDIDGVRFMSLGGAWSIDQHFRTPHRSWWPQEELTEADLRRALDGPPVDVLLTHDMPADQEAVVALGFRMAPGGDQNRRYVSEVMYALKPRTLVHGHMHARYETRVGSTHVIGLDCDGTGERGWIVFDSDKFERELT